jgi:hypothetical protein
MRRWERRGNGIFGMLIAGTGSVLHRNAVARRGRFDRDHPLPTPPWQPDGPGGA